MVAALSGSLGVTAENGGSSSREPLSLISDSRATVESPAVSSSRAELGSTAPEPDWKRTKTEEEEAEERSSPWRCGAALTVVRRSSAEKRSSHVAVDFSKASCLLRSFSTSSTVWPTSLLDTCGSWAISHASATEASRAN
ncbi:hypothetical protein EYF80_053040 [Liparis tanakae]|uniref:Uncharacterized protein n=1 Tax=Liparis tanakae TaxID=230148 RepID=A0A4Z2F6W8_9TELE|nr:hypothetical protein EYF80_053040 [Liparis tanakae]